ncbi:unnamed protein product, partial [Nesidiocoris tenuis]
MKRPAMPRLTRRKESQNPGCQLLPILHPYMPHLRKIEPAWPPLAEGARVLSINLNALEDIRSSLSSRP